jgi:phosphoglycolate phosphatase
MAVSMKAVVFGKRIFEPDLIIFDKDGTLTDFKKTWLPILEKRIDIILEQTTFNHTERAIRERIHKTFGIKGDRIDPYGPFPYTPPLEDEIIFATVLYELGVPWEKGKMIARTSLVQAEEEIDRVKITQLYHGVKDVLVNLKRCGILLTLATADLTDIANDTLKKIGIYDLFDYVIGTDMVEKNKPNPEMISKILDALGVKKGSSVMVGDTITDMEMGRRANIGLVVGVTEGGIASQLDLQNDADVVLSSVREIRVV